MRLKNYRFLLVLSCSFFLEGSYVPKGSCPPEEAIKFLLLEWEEEGRPLHFRPGWKAPGVPFDFKDCDLAVRFMSRYHYDGSEYCRYGWEALGRTGMLELKRPPLENPELTN